MPEGMNVEVAHKLSERERSDRHKHRWEEAAEIFEVLVLAIAAIATAWTGYQAALVADWAMFNGWLEARAADDPQLQAVFVRRFTPDYRSAFAAWLKTEPFTNSSAPAGPAYMPGYRNPQLEQAKRLNEHAAATFAEGTAARETADKYVRATVLFALVLFLVAVGQRFKARGVRIGANTVAVGLLAYALFNVSTLPRL